MNKFDVTMGFSGYSGISASGNEPSTAENKFQPNDRVRIIKKGWSCSGKTGTVLEDFPPRKTKRFMVALDNENQVVMVIDNDLELLKEDNYEYVSE